MSRPGLNANEIQIPYDKHHKVSSLVKSHQITQFCQTWSNMKMSNNPAKYKVISKQYLRSIMDISAESHCKLRLQEKEGYNQWLVRWPPSSDLLVFFLETWWVSSVTLWCPALYEGRRLCVPATWDSVQTSSLCADVMTVCRRHDCVQTFHAKKVTLFLFCVKLNSKLFTET